MDDIRVGLAIRALRRRRGWRQSDVAARAGMSQSLVSRIERGHLGTVSLEVIRRVAAALEMRLDLTPRWRGGDLDRVLTARHAALSAWAVTELQARGWVVRPEVTFSIWGERGSVDLLAWHPGRRALLVVEVKTELVDPHALLGQVDRYRRLAPDLAASEGRKPAHVSVWVVLEESPTNRRRLAQHRSLIRAAMPADGRNMNRWAHDPASPIRAFSLRPSPLGVASRTRIRARVAGAIAEAAPP